MKNIILLETEFKNKIIYKNIYIILASPFSLKFSTLGQSFVFVKCRNSFVIIFIVYLNRLNSIPSAYKASAEIK
jgi:hypothetical protein